MNTTIFRKRGIMKLLVEIFARLNVLFDKFSAKVQDRIFEIKKEANDA